MLLERPCTICKTRATTFTSYTSCTNCTTYTICTTCTWADFQVPVAWRCYWWTPPVHSEPLEAAQPNPWNKEILLWRSISINRPFSYSLILLSDWLTYVYPQDVTSSGSYCLLRIYNLIPKFFVNWPKWWNYYCRRRRRREGWGWWRCSWPRQCHRRNPLPLTEIWNHGTIIEGWNR